jgi:alkylation response protein AidB-like acyl-CoA dehydrogenase
VAEEISAVNAAAEMARLASAALYSAPLPFFGNSVQKKQFLSPVLSGEKVGALALTEPQAGSDAGSIKTRARRSGRDFVLNGEKRFITNGGSRTISSFSLSQIPVDLLSPRLARSRSQGVERVLRW